MQVEEKKKPKELEKIDWSKWWPFKLATGDAYRYLNRKEPKPTADKFGEALF